MSGKRVTEKDMVNRLVDSLRKQHALVTRIENTIGRGIPDIHVAFKGVETWIEAKANTLYIRPEQYVWAYKRNELNLNSYFFVYFKETYGFYSFSKDFIPLQGKYRITTEPIAVRKNINAVVLQFMQHLGLETS